MQHPAPLHSNIQHLLEPIHVDPRLERRECHFPRCGEGSNDKVRNVGFFRAREVEEGLSEVETY